MTLQEKVKESYEARKADTPKEQIIGRVHSDVHAYMDEHPDEAREWFNK